MAASDYTDIFARFSDQVAAETLARFIAEAGISCDLVEVSDSPLFGRRFGIRVARGAIADLKEILKLRPVANYKDAVSAEVAAGRLAREGVPCYIGGPPVLSMPIFGLGYSGVPIDDTGKLRVGTLAVPASFVHAALRILNEEISEDELTKLALGDAASSEDEA